MDNCHYTCYDITCHSRSCMRSRNWLSREHNRCIHEYDHNHHVIQHALHIIQYNSYISNLALKTSLKNAKDP